MRAIRLLAVLAIASTSLAAAPAPKKAAPRAAAPANWNALVARTPSGTHLLGNPNAKVRLGEYVSYTCSTSWKKMFDVEDSPPSRAFPWTSARTPSIRST